MLRFTLRARSLVEVVLPLSKFSSKVLVIFVKVFFLRSLEVCHPAKALLVLVPWIFSFHIRLESLPLCFSDVLVYMVEESFRMEAVMAFTSEWVSGF